MIMGIEPVARRISGLLPNALARVTQRLEQPPEQVAPRQRHGREDEADCKVVSDADMDSDRAPTAALP